MFPFRAYRGPGKRWPSVLSADPIDDEFGQDKLSGVDIDANGAMRLKGKMAVGMGNQKGLHIGHRHCWTEWIDLKSRWELKVGNRRKQTELSMETADSCWLRQRGIIAACKSSKANRLQDELDTLWARSPPIGSVRYIYYRTDMAAVSFDCILLQTQRSLTVNVDRICFYPVQTQNPI